MAINAKDRVVWLVTGNHVVKSGAEGLKIAFADGYETQQVAVLDTDKDIDIALLKVDDVRKITIDVIARNLGRRGYGKSLRRFDNVHVCGHPGGSIRWTLPTHASAFDRFDTDERRMYFEPPPGFRTESGVSGGAILTDRLEVVGVLEGYVRPFARGVAIETVFKRFDKHFESIASHQLTAAATPLAKWSQSRSHALYFDVRAEPWAGMLRPPSPVELFGDIDAHRTHALKEGAQVQPASKEVLEPLMKSRARARIPSESRPGPLLVGVL
ncbi:MAG: S1 family peptidase [Planctomycetota bacterium]